MKATQILTLVVVLFLHSACANKQKVSEKVTEDKPLATEGIRVLLSTSFGDMTIELYDETPLHRDNFAKLVEEQFYDSLLFHRVMEGFMIQGGDPQSKGAAQGTRLGTGGPGYTVPAEILPEFFHKKGALAAARQPDRVNPLKASSGSQFYILQGNVMDSLSLNGFEKQMKRKNPEFKFTEEQLAEYTTIGGYPSLDGEYTVFGEVISGINVIDSIAAVRVDGNNRPISDIIIKIERLN